MVLHNSREKADGRPKYEGLDHWADPELTGASRLEWRPKTSVLETRSTLEVNGKRERRWESSFGK